MLARDLAVEGFGFIYAEIMEILPLAVPVVVTVLGIRKGAAYLLGILRGA